MTRPVSVLNDFFAPSTKARGLLPFALLFSIDSDPNDLSAVLHKLTFVFHMSRILEYRLVMNTQLILRQESFCVTLSCMPKEASTNITSLTNNYKGRYL